MHIYIYINGGVKLWQWLVHNCCKKWFFSSGSQWHEETCVCLMAKWGPSQGPDFQYSIKASLRRYLHIQIDFLTILFAEVGEVVNKSLLYTMSSCQPAACFSGLWWARACVVTSRATTWRDDETRHFFVKSKHVFTDRGLIPCGDLVSRCNWHSILPVGFIGFHSWIVSV